MCKAGRVVVFFIVAICGILQSKEIRITYPSGGETFYIGDTIVVTFTADSEYISGGTGSQMYISVDRKSGFGLMIPVGETSSLIKFDNPLWGKAKYLLTDSIKVRNDTTYVRTNMSMVSDNAVFKVADYKGISAYPTAESKPFKVRPASEKPKTTSNEDGDTGCGKGASLALIPLLLTRILKSHNKNKRNGRNVHR